MKDLAARLDSASNCETEGLRTVLRLNPPQGTGMCYTPFALITSVVLCGPSGAVFDLRLPPPVSSVSFTRNLKQDWQSKPPAAQEFVCEPRRLLPARKQY